MLNTGEVPAFSNSDLENTSAQKSNFVIQLDLHPSPGHTEYNDTNLEIYTQTRTQNHKVIAARLATLALKSWNVHGRGQMDIYEMWANPYQDNTRLHTEWSQNMTYFQQYQGLIMYSLYGLQPHLITTQVKLLATAATLHDFAEYSGNTEEKKQAGWEATTQANIHYFMNLHIIRDHVHLLTPSDIAELKSLAQAKDAQGLTDFDVSKTILPWFQHFGERNNIDTTNIINLSQQQGINETQMWAAHNKKDYKAFQKFAILNLLTFGVPEREAGMAAHSLTDAALCHDRIERFLEQRPTNEDLSLLQQSYNGNKIGLINHFMTEGESGLTMYYFHLLEGGIKRIMN